MSNRDTVMARDGIQLYIYESGDEDYSINVNIDVDSISSQITLNCNMSSKEVISVALRMIEIAMPANRRIADKIQQSIENIFIAMNEAP